VVEKEESKDDTEGSKDSPEEVRRRELRRPPLVSIVVFFSLF